MEAVRENLGYMQGGNRVPTKKTKRVYSKTKDPKVSYLRKIFSTQKCDANPAHRNIPWTLTFEEWTSIVTQDCYLCGAEPVLREGKLHMFQGTRVPINGIDRIDNKIGYTLNNSRPCCPRCNYMKHNMSDRELITHILKILHHNNEIS